MAITLTHVDQMAVWCRDLPALAEERILARQSFFAYDDPRPRRYWAGTGFLPSQDLRCLGWFMFDHKLRDGKRPAEMAAEALYSGSLRDEALKAVRGTRYLTAVARAVVPPQTVFLDLETERFEVRSRQLVHVFRANTPVICHLVPSSRGVWVVGPGWTMWPVALGNKMRELKRLQTDPVSMERVLQGRRDGPEDVESATDRRIPRDATLAEAVERMSEAAREMGRPGLVMPVEEWTRLVREYQPASDFNSLGLEVFGRLGVIPGTAEAKLWTRLLANIWNNTTQPERGGKTPDETSREVKESGGPP